MARTANAGLYRAFDTCREILQEEGGALSMAAMKRLMRERFPDVLQDHSTLIADAGITVILRQIMKRHAGANNVSSEQIAIAFEIPKGLPERVAIPADKDSPVAREWLDLHGCTLRDLSKAIGYLGRQIRNDGKKRRSLESLLQRVKGVIGDDMNSPLTVGDAVMLLEEVQKGKGE